MQTRNFSIDQCASFVHCFARAGESALSAYHKVNQGWLFPLANAICFVERPCLLLPLAGIAQVDFGRASNVSSTFDFLITLKTQVRWMHM